MSQTILITGASSGLGLAFLQHYASLPITSRIIALDYNALPPSFTNTKVSAKIDFHKADISSPTQIQSIASQDPTTPITLLLHCAGIRGLVPSVLKEKKDVAAAETHAVMDHAIMLKTFEINTFGTFNMISSFLPNLRLAPNPKVVILSSRMGSIASNTTGGGYAYRASKAALNAVVKSFSIDVPDVKFSLVHPGRVETGLVGWKEEGAISVEESLGDCLRIIEGLNGQVGARFVDRFGAVIPW
ncbi:NAD(P)-binding protein [Setomelanomma holmii]|uniref:NAD(P)-binding protein n=1 Tax=Setomelanomma holmii TaxID=210430 RepID=A0A9P4HGX9_9PLEO|nr:NAD(P)-binding protein [Setomelanomma holmii]